MLDQNTIKQIEDIGFKLCTFDDECDTCKEPQLNSFYMGIYIHDSFDEDGYYMCGKCILAEIKKHYYKTNAQMMVHFHNMDKQSNLPF